MQILDDDILEQIKVYELEQATFQSYKKKLKESWKIHLYVTIVTVLLSMLFVFLSYVTWKNSPFAFIIFNFFTIAFVSIALIMIGSLVLEYLDLRAKEFKVEADIFLDKRYQEVDGKRETNGKLIAEMKEAGDVEIPRFLEIELAKETEVYILWGKYSGNVIDIIPRVAIIAKI